VTLVEQAPEFQLVNGWTQATLPAPAGVLPAGLWGKVPGGDPYLLHVSVLTTGPLAVRRPVRAAERPAVAAAAAIPAHARQHQLVLVRPTDRLRFVVAAQLEVAVELLVESIGGVNELGSRLFAWAQATQAAEAHKATSGVVVAPLQIPAWTGLFHLIHNSANVDLVTLPPRGLVPLDATLTLTRRGNGTPVLTRRSATRCRAACRASP
jgi:hypothetical protein